ncbi:TPA: glucuronyl hydrolase [Salmonella enterica]|uniref:Glucuronyl hydrolase n=1 Tax=Salmonella enterica TaxID=28901 RepID=A0A759YHZ4_SALER|nr:glucuronyl hydrolase [Salmonella enterica subsp. enterica serovar Newport]MDJ6848921.1 hypothetical protein [Salmonella enterica]HAG2283764.1 glucuronyl hydrolase [Salmonella enterica]
MSKEKLSHKDIISAIAALIRRIDAIEDESCGHFPLYRFPDRQWKLSAGGSWMGGFWAGVLYLKAFKTRSRVDWDNAVKMSKRLESKLNSDTLQRSFIFHYGAGLSNRLFGEPMTKQMCYLAGLAIAKSEQAELGFIPLGSAMGGGTLGSQIFSIDPLASTLSLLSVAGYRELAGRQMSKAVSACYEQTGRWYSEASYQSGQFIHHGVPGDWARGQAWAMLALMRAVHLFGDDYWSFAWQTVEHWCAQYSYHIPINRLSQPEGERDPCASLIACIAMLGLARLMPDTAWLESHALQQLATVVRSGYLDEGQFALFGSGALFKEGQFIGHCYRTSEKEESCVESPCGIFYLFAALMAADRQIEPLWL